MIELFSSSLGKLWKEWELRALVLLSLTLQVVLIILGNRRKYIDKLWIRIVVWASYLAADSVATFALGIISRNIGDASENGGSLDSNIQLTAFWAPFLLLHLGGPDTITAYALEDNELWLRHLLGLALQTGVAGYILFMTWTGRYLSILAIPIFLAGLIKYGERTFVLWSASNDQLRDSMLNLQNLPSRGTKSTRNYGLNEEEGYIVREDTVSYVELPIDFSEVEDNSLSKEVKLVTAYGFLEMTKRLFLDAVLSSKDRDACLAAFSNMPYKNVLEIIEMELGFMYDILYTKAMAAHTPCGIGLRFISFLLTCTVLVLFSVLYDTEKYSKVEISITFLLLTVAILLELYAALVLVFSDRAVVWLRKQKRTTTLRAINSLSPFGNRRWSNSMGQYSLLSYFLKEKPIACQRILELLRINQKLETLRYEAHHKVTDDLKRWIFEYFNNEYIMAAAGKIPFTALCTSRGTVSMSRYNFENENLKYWSTKVELEQSILFWHIITELCYHLDHQYFTQNEGSKQGSAEGIDENSFLNRKMIKYISRYMMYLFAASPKQLPPGGVLGQISLRKTCTDVLGQISLQETCAEARRQFEISLQETRAEARKQFEWFKPKKVFEWFKPKKVEERKTIIRLKVREGKRAIRFQACTKLLEIYARSDSGAAHEDVPERSDGSLLDMACKFSKGFSEDKEIIGGVWMELLAYAATQCRGSQHAQQLRQGGVLLTYVWLLMAHFGLTEHFKISQSPDIAKARFL